MNFSAWAIRNPVPPILLFFVLCVLGTISFMGLPITKFPNIDLPMVLVSVTDQGSAPSELESQITKKVEDAVAGITGVDHIQSDISDSLSKTVVTFKLEINSDRALNDVKDAISKIRSDLPRTINEPIVQRLDAENQPIATYGVASPGMTIEQLSWFVDDTVLRSLQTVRGVSRRRAQRRRDARDPGAAQSQSAYGAGDFGQRRQRAGEGDQSRHIRRQGPDQRR